MVLSHEELPTEERLLPRPSGWLQFDSVLQRRGEGLATEGFPLLERDEGTWSCVRLSLFSCSALSLR
jgi:hypothetical protein